VHMSVCVNVFYTRLREASHDVPVYQTSSTFVPKK